jgi:predicted transcriptional regulator
MSTRTTLLLDDASRSAAKRLAARLQVSPSEVVRRAIVHYSDHVLGVSAERRRRRKRALERLAGMFEGHDADAEVRRLKDEDEGF